jgi:PhzF family phenazine biosynthesis protein
MRTYRLYQVDAFTRTIFTGNPAGVVPDADGLSDQEMQQIARELNNSETAFLLSPADATHDVWVRFFTPLREVPLCGHATIAAHTVRALELKLTDARVLQRTGAGVLPVQVSREGDACRITMTQGTVQFGNELNDSQRERLLCALQLTVDDLRADCPVQIVSAGHSKVMIPLRNRNRLHALTPDLPALARLSAEIGGNGYYPFTLHPDEEALVHGRMFAPAIGIAEDPVTGNANGPLGAYLVRYGRLAPQEGFAVFTAVQGEAIGRTGQMEVRVRMEGGNPVEVSVTGYAVVVFFTTLTLEDAPRP